MQPPPPPNPAPPAVQADPAEALIRAEQAAAAKRLNEAMGICRDVLETHAEHPAALAMLGSILGHRGEMAESIRLLERAVAQNGQVAAWRNNLCSLYRMECRLEEAEREGRAALALAPGQPTLLLNLAKVFMDRGDDALAIPLFQDVLAREPFNAEAHLAIGQMLLARGEMRPGWAEYEWRNRLEQAKGMIPDMIRPEWNGMALPGATIMLIGDQGFGDTLQFARFIPQVAARCGHVALACGGELEGLLRPIPGVGSIFSRWQDAPPHQVWCRITSLGGIFEVGADNMPPAPYLSAAAEPRAAWAERLARDLPSGRRRVGIFWSGRPTHPNDRRRSLRLAQLAPLLALAGEVVDMVSLQKLVPDADRALLAAHPVLDLSAELTDFSVTAAILTNLDMLVTIDSGIAHLAGALGVPVTMLSPSPADWRWLNQGSDSVWYPSMHILRQPSVGQWTPVIEAAAARVAALAARPASDELGCAVPG